MSIYDFEVKDSDGNMVSLSQFKNKVLLIVNTAIKCGFAPQYTELNEMYAEFNEQGFEILDFPCNQFANQASGTEEEIVDFCQSRYGITFKMFKKVEVNGETAEPLFKYLREQKSGMMGDKIKWNFTKFLVDRNGNVVGRFSPTTTPEQIDTEVAKLL